MENLFLLGKVWGFLKYYHPTIASGKFDWDKELINFLPVYTKATSVNERSDLLGSWISQFGEVPECKTCNDSLLQNAKLKPDFSWVNETNFSGTLVKKLLFIRDHRIRKDFYYVKPLSADGIHLTIFSHENAYSNLVLPNDGYGLLALFRFWNAVEYWYPYKYNLPKKWDDVLISFIPRMLMLHSDLEYTVLLEQLVTAIYDSHGWFMSPLTNKTDGEFYMPFTVKIIENKLLVTSVLVDSLATLSNIKKGDLIEEIDGVGISSLIKKFALTTPASNEGSLFYKLSSRLTRSDKKQGKLKIYRDGKDFETIVHNYTPGAFPPVDLYPAYFSHQRDSSFFMIDDQIGYINVGVFNRADSLELAKFVSGSKSLIIDNRQNQDEQKGTGGGDIIAKLVLPEQNKFVKLATAQPTYPGTFTVLPPTNMGVEGSKNPFKGKIAILIDNGTISVGEFITMAFQKALHTVTVGGTTSGADGNVTYITLPGNFFVQFTGLGIYYPDGRETQRVGIKPDIAVKPTMKGYLENKDEQLLKAIEYLQKSK